MNDSQCLIIGNATQPAQGLLPAVSSPQLPLKVIFQLTIQ